MDAYFDNCATTEPCEEAINAVTEALTRRWGNPSSLDYKGDDARELVENSRRAVAAKLGCSPEELIFSSGGTESNNLAIKGAARRLRRAGNRIVSTSVEHSSVNETLDRLSAEGFEVVKLKVDKFGKINEKDIFAAVNSQTILITIMLVNNETGTIMPVSAAKRAAVSAGAPALIHCDAVQAFGKLPFKPSDLGVDLLTISSHKIHGPKGAGAVYIRKGVGIAPEIFGGEQERKIRPGTEPVPAIAGFGAAAKALPDPKPELERVKTLRDYLLAKLLDAGGIVVNSPPDALPYIVNVSVLGIKSEPMRNFLSERGICVSSGSACSRGKKSRTLVQMGLDPKRLESPLRVSFSRFSTVRQTDALIAGITEGQRIIRKTK